ncbi:MAG: alpha/beta hydrolase fold domain-containing protein [Pseudobutyrivibrio sp.]|nr:alpha/beta hydrolase fold domain-containing protein [Pseudobutyrivibrio sp.]
MKILKRIGLVFLCIILFVTSGLISGAVYTIHKFHRSYDYLKVRDKSLYTVEYDLNSDGKETTKYDLYLPSVIDEEKDYALIFYVHGGGFSGGDKEDGKYICPYYASHGYVAVSANYTLSVGDGVSNINTMFSELRNTMESVVKECADRGIKITQAATSGPSAGGCLAMLLAYRDPESSVVPVRFVFQQVGPASLDPDLWGMDTNDGKEYFVFMTTGKDFSNAEIGSEEYLNEIKIISPAALVNKYTVPTLMAYGSRDAAVPVDIKYELINAFEEYGVTYDYLEFPHSGHGLLDDPKCSEQYYQMVDEYIEKYFRED